MCQTMKLDQSLNNLDQMEVIHNLKDQIEVINNLIDQTGAINRVIVVF